MQKQTGGCQCGATRYEVTGEMHFSCVCHCRSCRKAAGAPLVGWAMFDRASVLIEPSNLSEFASSEGVRRSFCRVCGTTLFFEADYMPGLIDITTESFDDPDGVQPTAQIWTVNETECIKQLPGLMRFDELPPQG